MLTNQSDWATGLQPLHTAARVGLKELCELFLNSGAIVSGIMVIGVETYDDDVLYSYIVVVTMVTQHYITPVIMDTLTL